MCGVVELNRFVVWGETVELNDGLRMRLALADWKKLRLYRGQEILVRLPGRPDLWVRVGEVIELSPNVLVTLAS